MRALGLVGSDLEPAGPPFGHGGQIPERLPSVPDGDDHPLLTPYTAIRSGVGQRSGEFYPPVGRGASVVWG